MSNYPVKQLLDKLYIHGRSYLDETEGVLYTDATCAGFELQFTGTRLVGSFSALPDTFVMPGMPAMGGDQPAPPPGWPWIAVFVDGAEEPAARIEVKDGDAVELFSAAQPQSHRIRVVKLTETFRTCLGLRSLEAEGTIEDFSPERKDVIEFIGDSITCGFGNETPGTSFNFVLGEENGWLTHGAMAARELDLEARFLCVSGIAVDPGMGHYGMRQLYPYADRIIEDKLAEQRGQKIESYRPYDFHEKPAKYIVLNLGTNDANGILFNPDRKAAEQTFRDHYRDFVTEIRKLNGPDATIICALGSMDYYLFSDIVETVNTLKQETGDEKLVTLKYGKMMSFGPDVGGATHPAVHRHKIMAKELVEKIQSL